MKRVHVSAAGASDASADVGPYSARAAAACDISFYFFTFMSPMIIQVFSMAVGWMGGGGGGGNKVKSARARKEQ